mmetsp:Transcript_59994/g.167384  ORF Transcript_59994/g.167384 Transcript_59994/m.167384 type:complete len:247 (+) Transcript_59994:702-1442(+)
MCKTFFKSCSKQSRRSFSSWCMAHVRFCLYGTTSIISSSDLKLKYFLEVGTFLRSSRSNSALVFKRHVPVRASHLRPHGSHVDKAIVDWTEPSLMRSQASTSYFLEESACNALAEPPWGVHASSESLPTRVIRCADSSESPPTMLSFCFTKSNNSSLPLGTSDGGSATESAGASSTRRKYLFVCFPAVNIPVGGIEMTSAIRQTWSYSDWPGKIGSPRKSSAQMQPRLHMSIAVVYGRPSSTSGDL